MKIKKIVASALLLCMVASLTACGSKEKTPEEEFSDSLNSAYDSIKNWASSASSELSKSYNYSSNSTSSEESSEISTNLKKIDPFKNLKITYTGSSPYIKASTDSTQCDSTVNKYFEFKTEDKYLRNGDEFTVTAVYNADNLEEDGFYIDTDTQTYVVDAQPEYITSVDGLDLSALQSELNDKLTATTATSNGDYSSWFFPTFAGIQLSGWFSSVKSKTLKATYLLSLKNQYENKYGNDSNTKYYNRYIQIYEYIVNQKEKDGTAKGQKRIYVIIYANNLANDGKGVLSWDLELDSKGYEEYNSAVNDYVTSKKEYYNVSEIK